MLVNLMITGVNVTTDFWDWLEKQMGERNWKPADLARAAGISQPTLTTIKHNRRTVGPEVAEKIARALGLPPEVVFRRADLLPAMPADDSEIIKRVVEVLKRLSQRERKEILEYAFLRYRLMTVETQELLDIDPDQDP